MFNEPHLTTFNRRERKLQFVVVVILIILLPVLLVLLQKALSIRSRAAPDASLRISPRNVARTADGKWRFTINRQTPVDVVINSGTNEVEVVQVGIFYDPTKMSLKKQGGISTDNITCSPLTPLKNKVAAFVSGLSVDSNGVETGEELGYATILCSAIEGAQSDVPYTPLPASFTGALATFMFTPLEISTEQTLSIHFTPEDPTGDSSILAYEGVCCSDTEVLQSVENLTFDIGSAETVASLALSPSSGTFSQGQTFDVQVNLSTGPHTVDSVDTIINYDASALEATHVSEGVIFPSYTKIPGPSGISVTGNQGKVELSAQISPSSPTGLQGDNLLFATITFRALRPVQATDVLFRVDSPGARNDTNIVLFQQGTDVLEEVTNAQYQIFQQNVTATPSITTSPYPASLRLSPTSGNQTVGREFDVAIYLSTGGQLVDSTDVVLRYNQDDLELRNVTYSDLFDDYQDGPESTTTTGIGEHGISGFISPQSLGVNADDQLFATVTFLPRRASESSLVEIVHEVGNRNDSNVSRFQSATDILGTVTNANYRIVGIGTGLIQQIRIRIALQGRQDETSSKAKDLTIRFLGTHFESNPIAVTSDTVGEVLLRDRLENRLNQGSYSILVKPRGYLQRRITASLNQSDNVLDLRDTPFRAGDLDNSGAVNSLDYVRILANWGSDNDDADIDDSGAVNTLDYTFMLSNWFAQDEQ